MPYADKEKQKEYCRKYQKDQRELLKKLKANQLNLTHPMPEAYCDYKRSCKNKGSRCGNCERNYENEIWEDNYEPKHSA
jgi:hypothetical protein